MRLIAKGSFGMVAIFRLYRLCVVWSLIWRSHRIFFTVTKESRENDKERKLHYWLLRKLYTQSQKKSGAQQRADYYINDHELNIG